MVRPLRGGKGPQAEPESRAGKPGKWLRRTPELASRGRIASIRSKRKGWGDLRGDYGALGVPVNRRVGAEFRRSPRAQRLGGNLRRRKMDAF